MSENDADRQWAVSATSAMTMQCSLNKIEFTTADTRRGYCREWDMKPAYH